MTLCRTGESISGTLKDAIEGQSVRWRFMADNYKEIWDIPATEGYLLGITTTDRFYALPSSASYAEAMEARILLRPDPSNAAQMFHDHYTGTEVAAPEPLPPVVIVNEGDGDDMRYQLGVEGNFIGEVTSAYMLMPPTGITQIPMGAGSIPSLISSVYANRGLSPVQDGEQADVAEGWSWEQRGRHFTVTDADGELAVSIDVYSAPGEAAWFNYVYERGSFTLHMGDELVLDENVPTREQLRAGRDRGNVVINHIGRSLPAIKVEPPVKDEPAPAEPPPAQEDRQPPVVEAFVPPLTKNRLKRRAPHTFSVCGASFLSGVGAGCTVSLWKRHLPSNRPRSIAERWRFWRSAG